MRVYLLACFVFVALCASTIATAEHVPPGWVDYTGATDATAWDNSQKSLSLPFTFDFYGGAYTTDSVLVQANGYLGFGPHLTNNNDPLAWPYYTWEERYSRIASPMWHDFNPVGSPGHLYYQTVGSGNERRFVVTWDSWADTDHTQENIFQAQLHEASGDISFHYLTLDGVEDGSRVGINYGDGVEYTGFWYDGAENFDGGESYNANQQGPTGSLEGYTITYTFDDDTDSYQATHAHVPAPGALITMLVALGGVAAVRRRKGSGGSQSE